METEGREFDGGSIAGCLLGDLTLSGGRGCLESVGAAV